MPPVGVLYVYMDKCKGMRVNPLKIDFRGILYKGYIIYKGHIISRVTQIIY